jgi:hypothetical protein
MRLRGSLFVAAIIGCLLFPSVGRAMERCVGWGITGAIAGGAIGAGTPLWAMMAAGEDLDDTSTETRRIALAISSASLGAIVGPIATCSWAKTDEPALPIASFMVAGGVIGAAAHTLPLLATEPGEGTMVIGALLFVVGSFAGGLAGWAIHRAWFGYF